MAIMPRKNVVKWLLAIGLGASLALPVQAAPVPNESTPVAAKANARKIELEFRPRVGEERVLRMNVVQNGTKVDGKKKSTMRQTVGIDTVYRVLSAATDGRVRLRATTRAVRLSQVVDGKIAARYDSAKADKPIGKGAEIMALLHGLSFVMQINSNGTIDLIENKEKIVEQMMDKMKVPQADREFLRPLITGAMDGSAFMNIGNTFASFDDEEVSIGDQWVKTDVVATNANLIYDGKVSLAKRAGGLSALNLQSTMKPDPQRASGTTVMPLMGTQKGYYVVEEKTGWTRRAHIEQFWNAHLDASGSPVPATAKSTGRLYMKMVFDVATLSAK